MCYDGRTCGEVMGQMCGGGTLVYDGGRDVRMWWDIICYDGTCVWWWWDVCCDGTVCCGGFINDRFTLFSSLLAFLFTCMLWSINLSIHRGLGGIVG